MPDPACRHVYRVTVIYYDEMCSDNRAHIVCEGCGHAMVGLLKIPKSMCLGIIQSIKGALLSRQDR